MADHSLPLSRLRERLARPRGKRRMEALLQSDHPAEAVAALSVVEIFHLVHDVGFAESVELVALSTPEQFRGCLDLDAWNRDHLDADACKPWLAALLGVGFDKVGSIWPTLDSEFRALFFARTCRVYDLSLGDEPPGDDSRTVVLTPDTYFAVEMLSTDEHSIALIRRLIADLYRIDPSGQMARHTLMAARSEPEAALEEMSYRWRSGRMADLGYIDHHEALEVFQPLDPASVTLDEGTQDRFGAIVDDDPLHSESLPVPVAERLAGLSFLSRALDRIEEPAELTRLEMASMVLINKVLAAARVSPGDRDALPVGAQHALSTLSLGLETLSQGDLARAEQALRMVSFTRLHRLGYTVTLRLAVLARTLRARAHGAGPQAAELLAALAGKRPFFPCALDVPAGSDIRPIASLDDVRTLALALTRLALRVAIADALGVNLEARAERPEPRPELDDYVRTALVRALLGQTFEAIPLSLEDIARLRTEIMPRGTIDQDWRGRAGTALTAFLDAERVDAGRAMLPSLFDDWMGDLEEALAHLPPAPDARFIGQVLLAEHQH